MVSKVTVVISYTVIYFANTLFRDSNANVHYRWGGSHILAADATQLDKICTPPLLSGKKKSSPKLV